MTLKILAPKTLAAAPVVLLANALPTKYELVFFIDHAAAVAALQHREIDILCTGFTEGARTGFRRVATYLWGLSALLVQDSRFRDLSSLAAAENLELLLPFEKSPLDLQVRALLKKIAPEYRIMLINTGIPEILQRIQQGRAPAAVLPEPLATLACDAGNSHRLANLSQLWAGAFGDELTPQVSCFCAHDAHLPDEFMDDLRKMIGRLGVQDLPTAQQIAEALGFSAETIQRALPQAVFALPDDAEVERLESTYRKILDSL